MKNVKTSYENLISAINLAGLASLIEGCPQGITMPVSAGGANLSGGQRQAIAIARAFAFCPCSGKETSGNRRNSGRPVPVEYVFSENQKQILTERIKQKEAQAETNRVQLSHLKNKAGLLKQQIDIAKPLVEKKIESENDFLELRQKQSDVLGKPALIRSTIPELDSQGQ